MKYKAGDKVRIVSEKKGYHWDNEGLMDKWLGKIMIISYYDEDGYYKMREDSDERGGNGWNWYDHMIECKVEYKVGDKVRIRSYLKRNRFYGPCMVVDDMKKYKGQIATIVDIDRDGTYKIDIDDRRWYWDKAMFEQIEQEKEETLMANRVLSDIQNIITKQPKVGEWISVEKELPKEKGYYLVTRKGHTCAEVRQFRGKKWAVDTQHFGEVIAWQPLPEPYKGD